MSLSAAQLRHGLDTIAAGDAAFARALAASGYPEPRTGRGRGYPTLLRTILGQQVSVASANAIWNKLAALVGEVDDPAAMLPHDATSLRTAGLSRQKASYALDLARRVHEGLLPLDTLPADDEAAITLLTAVKGLGRWSAEIYLLFAEGRPDVWPAGDLAVQVAVGRVLGLAARPGEKATRAAAEAWRPHRGAAAVFMWHHYAAAPAPL